MIALAGQTMGQPNLKLPTFSEPHLFFSDPGQSFAWGLAAGDVDGDGYPEIAVAHAEADLTQYSTLHTGAVGTVRVWWNRNTWEANPGQSLEVLQDVELGNNTSPSEVALVNIDDDDDLEMIVATGYAYVDEGEPVRGVFTVQYGEGEFQDVLNEGMKFYETASGIRALAVADFNNDGYPDIALATDPWEFGVEPVVYFLENDASDPGVFIAHGPTTIGFPGNFPSAGLAAGDFNRISIGGIYTDVVSGNAYSDNISVLTNGDQFVFAPLVTNGCGDTEWMFRQLAAGQFELGSGDWDLAAVTDLGQHLFILHGDRFGGFSYDCDPEGGHDDLYPAAYDQCGNRAEYDLAGDVAVADLNGDPRPDLVVSDPTCDDPRVVLYLGKGDGTFQVDATKEQYCPRTSAGLGVGAGPFNVLAVDLDLDGFDDIITSNHGEATAESSISVLINQLGVATLP